MPSHMVRSFAFICVFLFVAPTTEKDVASKKAAKLPLNQLKGAVYCIAQRDWDLGSVRKFSGGEYFRVRYVYGIYDPSDRENELHLVMYAQDNRSAWLYEIYIEKRAGQFGFLIGNIAKLKRANKGWRVLETHGGIYSYDRVRRLVNKISQKVQKVIPYPQDAPSDSKCLPEV